MDTAGKTFTLRDPKNHQDHTLPMSGYLLELLTRRKAVAASEFVFADANGRRISTTAMRRQTLKRLPARRSAFTICVGHPGLCAQAAAELRQRVGVVVREAKPKAGPL